MRTVLTPRRYLAVWVPDWPIHAFLREVHAANQQRQRLSGSPQNKQSAHTTPLTHRDHFALIHQHSVVAASPAARSAGVAAGMREAEAQSLCPQLQLFPYEAERDAREFYSVVHALYDCIPNIQPVHPGLMVVPGRGPKRYYGSETAAAQTVQQRLQQLGLPAQVGCADGHFTACQAAFVGADAALSGVEIVPPEQSATFLSSLPVSCAAGAELTNLLTSMGIRTLGDFANLPEQAVRERCGTPGLVAWHHAHGHDVSETAASPTEKNGAARALFDARIRQECVTEVFFDSPALSAEELAFGSSAAADEFIAALQAHRLVCTTLRISLVDSTGATHDRSWQHPEYFSAADVIGRLRWQAAASQAHPSKPKTHAGADTDYELPAWNGFIQVRFSVEAWDYAVKHEPELWTPAVSARLYHQLSRIQATLGYEAVLTLSVQGGRLLHERSHAQPWGAAAATQPQNQDQAQHSTHTSLPWPGSLPDPHPTIVFSPPKQVDLFGRDHHPVNIDGDDLLAQRPTMLQIGAHAPQTILHWSAPWPIRERWWEGVPATHRLQVTLEDGVAWLLLHRNGCWYAEGRYD
jgi:protein ImuB